MNQSSLCQSFQTPAELKYTVAPPRTRGDGYNNAPNLHTFLVGTRWPAVFTPNTVRELILLCEWEKGGTHVVRLLGFLPQLTHLTVAFKKSLNRILGPEPHPNLRYLSLETPPQHRDTSSIEPWCISAALDQGLLSGPTRAG